MVGHIRPDGDCIGSLLGVHYILEYLGIEHTLAAEDLARNGYEVYPGFGLIESAPREGFEPDLILFVDTADRSRAFPDWKCSAPIINIDHHGSNTRFGGINWIEAGRSSVGEMIYVLARHSATPVQRDLANVLLLAIMTDTGSFRYSNVRPETLEIAAELVRAGADVPFVAGTAYENRSPESIKLTGLVMNSLTYECGGKLVWGEIRADVLEALGADKVPENLVSDMRGIRGVRVSLLFTETPGMAGLRVSLRGDGSIDVSAIAQRLGGGGHRNAAGITIAEGTYESGRNRVIESVRRAVEAT